MKLITTLIIIIISFQFSVGAKVIIKCDQIQGKWAPIYVNCHKVEDSTALKSNANIVVQPIYFTPQEIMYKNISYGNFPTEAVKVRSMPKDVDYKSLRSPASAESSDTE
jgi:hypothetical protein